MTALLTIVVTVGFVLAPTGSRTQQLIERECSAGGYGTRMCTEWFATGPASKTYTDQIIGMSANKYEGGLKRGRCMPSPETSPCIEEERSLGRWRMRRIHYEDGYACVAELEDPLSGTWAFELDADTPGKLTIRVPEMRNPEGHDDKNSEHPITLHLGRQAVPAQLRYGTYRPELAVRFSRRLQFLLARAVDLRVSVKAREFRVRTGGSAQAVRFLQRCGLVIRKEWCRISGC